MGQRMPDLPIEYGNDCSACFDADKTPEFVYVRFSQLIKCTGVGKEACLTPPNDRLFKLTQDPVIPCRWRYLGTTWEVWYLCWRVPDNLSSLQLIDFNHQLYFEKTLPQCPPEGTVWHGELACDLDLFCAESGICVITWTPQATALLAAINMSKGPDLFMELFPLDDGKLVYKFCRIKESTNIKMLYDPRTYEVTGTLVPDVTGTYNPALSYNDKRCYEITTTQWFLWWDGIDTWNISTVPGVQGTDFWTRTDPAIEGLYTPGGTAAGDATVSLIV